MQIYSQLETYIRSLSAEDYQLSETRKQILQELTNFILERQETGDEILLTFICTHNSRRSHFGQIWAKVLADYYDIPHVFSYSGGTESTAFHPNAIRTLRSVGFGIEAISGGENPHYSVKYSETADPIMAWSKEYNDPANPQSGFCAIMTCSEADEACPMVLGASKRISLPYEDPKKADGTMEEAKAYLARCRQIATELAFVFEHLV